MVLLTNDTVLEQNSENSGDNPDCLDSVLAEVKKKQEELRKMQKKQAFLLENLNTRLRELEEKMKSLGEKQQKLDTAKKLLKSKIGNENSDELQLIIDNEFSKMLESLDINWEDASKRSEIVDHLYEWSSRLGYVNFTENLFVLDPELKRRIAPSQEENKIQVKTSSSENIEKNENEPGIEERKEESCNTPCVSQQSACETVSFVKEEVPENVASINDKIAEGNAASSKEDISVITVSADEVKAEPGVDEKSGAQRPVGTGQTSSVQEKLLEAEEPKLKNTAQEGEEKKLQEESKENKSKKESSVETQRVVELRNMLKFRKNTVTDKCSKFRPSKFFRKSVKQCDEATLDLVEALKLEEESIALREKIAAKTIFLSACEGYSKIVDFLLKKLPETRHFSLDGNNPLHIATINNHAETVKTLIKGGVDVDARNFALASALGISVQRGNVQLVAIFLTAGADINALDLMSQSPLHFAADGNDYGSPKIRRLKCLQLLLEAGANKEVRDTDGATPLMIAVFTDNKEAVGILLRAGADVNAQNNMEQSALHFAVRDGQKKIFRMLLQARANIELQDSGGFTALHVAVIRERTDFITELLKAGANHLVRDRRGRLPAQWTDNSRIKAMLHMEL